jgi:hypothetical protein
MKNNFAREFLGIYLLLLPVLPLGAQTLDTGILGTVTDPGERSWPASPSPSTALRRDCRAP